MRARLTIVLVPGLCGALLLAFAISSNTAEARIKCKGIFQVTKNGLISTPYCQEEEIARVARSYGWKVTASQVHNDPLKKVYICQVLGRDNRLKGACGAYATPGPYRF